MRDSGSSAVRSGLGSTSWSALNSGATVHAVDLVAYDLAPGDTLWIHAGQVQQWGDIGAIDGPVALFTPRALDLDTLARIRATGMALRSHFPAGSVVSGQDLAWSYLRHCATLAAGVPEAVGAALVARSLAALLLELVAVAGTPGRLGDNPPRTSSGCATRSRRASPPSAGSRHTRGDSATRPARSTASHVPTQAITAKALIDERVMLEAQRMLVHGDEPVATIAGALGFDDPSNFSKYFTQRAGSTPAVFRRRARGREVG